MRRTSIVIVFLAAAAFAFMASFTPVFAQAEQPAGAEKFIGAGLAMGFAGLGAGVGMGIATSGALAAMVDKPEIFSNAILLIVLIEAVAIYGLVVAFIIIIL
ncbi:MAG: ATP synthase subunit C [Candidatus Geothermarchaeales archaeon]